MITIDMLKAFYISAKLGSFSEAARQLGKAQSGISTMIANLEIDTGLKLFDRSKKYPELTAEGRILLTYAKNILDAVENMDRAVTNLVETNIEKRITLVLSDTYHISPSYNIIREFEEKFPFVELELLDAEGKDIISLVQNGRAQIGLVASQDSYPIDIISNRLPNIVEMGIFINKNHPVLVKNKKVDRAALLKERQICLNTYTEERNKPLGKVWLASDYMFILEMVEEGFGWAELPISLLKDYNSSLIMRLDVPDLTRVISTDIIRSNQHSLGAVSCWFIERLLKI